MLHYNAKKKKDQSRDTLILTLTISKKTLHLLAGLVVVDEDVEAEALETFEQLTGVSVGAVPYIHACRDALLSVHVTDLAETSLKNEPGERQKEFGM